jgi:hypothetical protein
MTDLSPAAQAVLDAVRYEVKAECYSPWIAAAALRAAADQVAPAGWTPYQHVRHELLAIADELEGADAG